MIVLSKQNTLNFQHSLLYGSLLGDAYLYPKKGIIQLEQSVENQEYLFWLFEKLKSCTSGKSPSLVTRIDKRSGQQTQSYRFYTKALFHEWRPHFYNESGKKILPQNLSQLLNPTALAIWFLDDGGRCSGVKKGVFLTIDNYTPEQIETLGMILKTIFGLTPRLHKSGKSQSGNVQKRFTFTGENYELFYDILKPVILELPSMVKKKLPNVSPFLITP